MSYDNGHMRWFGSSWDAPLNDETEGCERQETPTGQLCFYCKEPIEWWASGVTMICYSLERGASRQPEHLECFVRGLGSVGHLLGLCSCDPKNTAPYDDPPWMTRREAARAAVLVGIALQTGIWFKEVWLALRLHPGRGSDG